MTSKSKVVGLLSVLVCLLAVCGYLYSDWGGPPVGEGSQRVIGDTATDLVADRTDELKGDETAGDIGERSELVRDANSITGVHGVVLDAKTRLPVAGVEVVALRVLPNLERPITRLRSLFSEGIWTDTSKPVEILASTISRGDGTFEIYGLPRGKVFLDARSDQTYVRNPGVVRLARGQVWKGLELLTSPGGRIVGRVFGPEGAPAKGAKVSVRPGLNALLGQLTQRKYKWLEASTDEDGRFVISGIPTGDGYSVTIASPDMALEARHGMDIRLGQTVNMTIHAKIGANVTGRAIDEDGAPVVGAQVAMIYLDIGRMLFSADGRDEPITTDENGYFQLQHVAPGRVAFIAATDSLAPSNIHELAVVDGGVYTDILLTLDKGRTFSGLVVDGQDQPISNVDVEFRPTDSGGGRERRGGEAMKVALKIRRVRATTGADGRFSTAGIAGSRLTLEFRKPGYITILKSRVKADHKDFKVVMTEGVTVLGRVQLADGTPVPRFQVQVRSREIRPSDGKKKDEAKSSEPTETSAGRQGPGVTVEVGFGSGRGSPRGRGRRGFRGGRGSSTTRMREGSSRFERGGTDSKWDEVKSAAGRFALHGFPSGKVRVSVRAHGFLDPESQEVELVAGASSDELVFVLDPGAICTGVVKDAATGRTVAEATVSAYRAKKKKAEDTGFRLFRPDMDPEDFDFLGLAGQEGRRSAMTNSKGEFVIKGLRAGDYRFTARHPDMAKASVKDVVLVVGQPTEGIEIFLSPGGAIEGVVTGKGKLPLGNAIVVVFGIQTGSFKSDATDARGFYRIDGLPPGQYIVFKSRMDERSQDFGMDLMNNMRIKTTTVRKNRTTTRDIHDESDDSVRIYGVVRDAGKPVPRAVMTFLGRDRDGLLGMGIRSKSTGDDGTYEIIGLEPGDYLLQIARFRGRSRQYNISIEIPDGVREFRLDIDLPQSYVEGIVQDTTGNPVPGVQVQIGLQEDAPIGGLVGLMLKNGIAQGRTDADGKFKVEGLAEGVYRLTASGKGVGFGRGRGIPQPRGSSNGKWGDVALENIRIDGVTPQTGLLLTLPLAGSITGIVVDGAGQPIAGAELHVTSDDRQRNRRRSAERAMTDLFGLQIRPSMSGADGRFEIKGLTPGKYRVRADVKDKAPGTADDVVVLEAQPTDVRIMVIKGATLMLRVRNIEGSNLPIANISVFDGKGKPLASKVSVMSVFMRYMRGKKKKDSSGWHEIGGIPPDTYTVVIKEKGQPDIKIVRTIRDGEKAKWDIDMAEELKRHKESKKK